MPAGARGGDLVLGEHPEQRRRCRQEEAAPPMVDNIPLITYINIYGLYKDGVGVPPPGESFAAMVDNSRFIYNINYIYIYIYI